MNKKTQKKIEKKIKKTHPLTKAIVALCFLVSLAGSFFVSWTMQKDDCFVLIGESVVTMNVGGTYVEPDRKDAIKCVFFGRDVSSSVRINEEETTYDPARSPEKEGTYYIVYEVDNFKYSGILRIRTIKVAAVDTNEDGIGDEA